MDWDTVWNLVKEIWPHLVATVTLLVDLAAAAHVVMYKKDTRAATGWVGIIWLVPVLGVVLYVLFGINRVQRRATILRGGRKAIARKAAAPESVPGLVATHATHLITLAKLVGTLTARPLLEGNDIHPLNCGDEAYPEMLRAIDESQRSVALASYIFDNDRAGRMFADALSRAVKRGVEVRVLIDAVGARYTFPSIEHALKAGGVREARFMPTLLPGRWAYANLRNHRKVLVVDGILGFTGGLNIREGHDLSLHPAHPIVDMHFRIRGPVVGHLQEVFAEDWEFSTGETLQGETWFRSIEPAGNMLARGITTGPDRDIDKLRIALLGAIACADSSIAIVSPYFLPDESLMMALNVAALRGVTVDIVLPGVNNLALVQWASTALLWELIERGCRIWISPPPFDHTKLMVVDKLWSLIGSANWDPRSLRLNFEFNVECYDAQLAGRLQDRIERRIAESTRVTLADVEGLSLPVRLRNGIARLFTPYL
jgi:cardiolipin synthase